ALANHSIIEHAPTTPTIYTLSLHDALPISEGRLGGQADVRGAMGIWRDLTDNVNSLAGNLTDQVRNIAKVTTAVAKGDLSQKIRSEEHTSELQSRENLVCRLLLEKKKTRTK